MAEVIITMSDAEILEELKTIVSVSSCESLGRGDKIEKNTANQLYKWLCQAEDRLLPYPSEAVNNYCKPQGNVVSN